MSAHREPQGSTGIAKAPTAIPGFDEIAAGGLPRGSTTLLLGGPGTGKTVFALQTLVNGARVADEPGIFIAFEEPVYKVRANAASFGWDVAGLERDGKLFFLDAQLPIDTVQSGSFDLEGMFQTLTAKVREMGAKRIVFDSVDVLLALFPEPQAANRELRRLHDWLTEMGSDLLGLITARIEMFEREVGLRYPFLLFVADCVVLLHYRVSERVALRELRVLKYRGAGFEQNEYPFTIGPEGMEVGSFGVREPQYPVSTQRISSGIGRLDAMLDGGYFRGSSILITGAPGTAKTTLAGAFVQAACRRKERALYIAFDEAASEIVRNLASVNIRLAPSIDTGLLQIHALRTEARSAEEHLIRIKTLIEGYEPRVLVVDPLSALVRAGGRLAALTVAQRLLFLAKSSGITLLATSLLEEAGDPTVEASQIRISTIADTWIHLSYVVSAGERNRALTVVKARGIGHSNQVREVVLSDEGITLSDVYTAGGAVLMGTLRMEREAEERLERERMHAEAARKRRELEAAEAEMSARVKALERELAAKRAELELLEQDERLREQIRATRQQAVRALRRADEEEPAAPRPPEAGQGGGDKG